MKPKLGGLKNRAREKSETKKLNAKTRGHIGGNKDQAKKAQIGNYGTTAKKEGIEKKNNNGGEKKKEDARGKRVFPIKFFCGGREGKGL